MSDVDDDFYGSHGEQKLIKEQNENSCSLSVYDNQQDKSLSNENVNQLLSNYERVTDSTLTTNMTDPTASGDSGQLLVIEATIPAPDQSYENNYFDESFASDSEASEKSDHGEVPNAENKKLHSNEFLESECISSDLNNTVTVSVLKKSASINQVQGKSGKIVSKKEHHTLTNINMENNARDSDTSHLTQLPQHHKQKFTINIPMFRYVKSIKPQDLDQIKSGDLSALLETVLHMDNDVYNKCGNSTSSMRIMKPMRSNSAMSGTRKCATPQRKNYSFSNDKVRAIELENQRLMQQILKQPVNGPKTKNPTRVENSKTKISTGLTACTVTGNLRRPTSSTINRNRELKRIDAENLAMLKRLQMVRPTKTMQAAAGGDQGTSDYRSSSSMNSLRQKLRPQSATNMQRQSGDSVTACDTSPVLKFAIFKESTNENG